MHHFSQVHPLKTTGLPYFAGDIMLTCPQANWLRDRLAEGRDLDLSCPTSPFKLWPDKHIYYDFDAALIDWTDLVQKVCIVECKCEENSSVCV